MKWKDNDLYISAMKNVKIIGLLLLIGIYSSCSKDDDPEIQTLTGLYTETIPHSGNHQLNFVDGNTLILKSRNSSDEEFIYSLNDNKIKLTPTRDISQSWELEIKIVNRSEFEITNIFYASFPEDDSMQFVTFEK